MANFGDELRGAPQQHQKEEELRRKRELEESTHKYNQENLNYANATIREFKAACMEEAKKGRRSIVWDPKHSQGWILIGHLVTDLFFSKYKMDRAKNEVQPLIERELATMGLRSYSVSVHMKSELSGYSTFRYAAFYIRASW